MSSSMRPIPSCTVATLLRDMFIGLAILLLATPLAPPASALTIFASGSGWCSNSFGCNSADTTTINNHAAGHFAASGADFRNWFAFDIPDGTVFAPGATIHIWSSLSNTTSEPDAPYYLVAASGFSYAGLASGAILGTIKLGDANTGTDHYASIALNATAIALLNGAAGGNFLFGGYVVFAGDPLEDGVFGFSDGTPIAFLDTSSSSAVPVPAALPLFASGLGVIGLLGWRRKRKHASTAATS
ncbi:MAG: hypothetical protein IT537_15655 [Hyphomicrobiales bacterium]|nr:hypothetical protein [Hyphomicrobiales bacterium]